MIIAGRVGVKAAVLANSNTAGCTLVNPPNSSVDWKIMGNQIIWVTYASSSALSTGITVTCNTLAGNNTEYIYFLPFETKNERKYSIFGNTPILWKFSIKTISDVASFHASARWDAY